MAKNVSLTVNVNDAQFQAFMKNFNAFSAKLTGLNNSFQQINTTIQNTQKQSNALLNTFKAMYQVTNSMLKPVVRITSHLLKWGTIIGGITALLGMGGGLFGIERLANSIMQKRRQVMGLGGTYGGTQAALIYGKTFLNDPSSTLQNIAAGQAGDPEKQRALLSMGEKFGGKDSPEVVMGRMLKRIPDLLKNVKPGAELAVLEAYGLKEFFSVPDLIRMTTVAGREEIKLRLQQIEQDKKELELSKEAQKGWTDFDRQLAKAGAHIQNALGEGLLALAAPLSKLSDAFVHMIQVLMDTDIVKQVIDQLAQWINQFADYLKTDRLQKDLKRFTDEVQTWLPWLKDLGDNLKSFGDILGNIVGVLKQIWSWVKWLKNIDDKTRIPLPPNLGPGSIGAGGATQSLTPGGEYQDDSVTGPQSSSTPQGSSRTSRSTSVTAPTTTTNVTAPQTEMTKERELAKTSPVFIANQKNATTVGQPSGNNASVNVGGTGGNYSAPNFNLGGFGGGNTSTTISKNQRFGNVTGSPIQMASNRTSSFNQRFAAATSAGGFNGGTSMSSSNNSNQFAAAAASRVPSQRGGAFGLAMNTNLNTANIQGRGRGPLNTDNWQMTRTAKLQIHNVPGSNVFMSGAGMSVA